MKILGNNHLRLAVSLHVCAAQLQFAYLQGRDRIYSFLSWSENENGDDSI